MGRDQSFISRIEAGSRQATFADVEQLAKNYSKPLSYFETITKVEEQYPRFAVQKVVLGSPREFEEKPWKIKNTSRTRASGTRKKKAKKR